MLPRLAIALAAMALLAGLILSPAGAAVREWIDDAFTDGVPNAEPSLTELPGGGRLLVRSAEGPWVVQADGSRRLLGRYREATWSPHGLFVGASAGRTLSALEPDGTPRWSISAGSAIENPRWSPSGFRIAYRAGRDLRVVDADGTGDRSVDAGVAPFPRPGSRMAHTSRLSGRRGTRTSRGARQRAAHGVGLFATRVRSNSPGRLTARCCSDEASTLSGNTR